MPVQHMSRSLLNTLSWRSRGGIARVLEHCSGSVHTCMYVCMHDYVAVSTRILTPPTTGTD